ncbi:MAG: hypothetical protein E7262_09035 [Lachnospiraceae bacterium]|nr:hypothetical protein [Lachnospiraceae bacterium]
MKNNGVKTRLFARITLMLIASMMIGVFCNVVVYDLSEDTSKNHDNKKDNIEAKSVGIVPLCCELDAKLYNNNKYTGDYVSLTSSGATLEGWNNGESRFLHVKVKVHHIMKIR